jgi:hypothetical protein
MEFAADNDKVAAFPRVGALVALAFWNSEGGAQ